MKFSLTKNSPPAKTYQITMTLNYEHGDGDLITHDTVTLPTMSLVDLSTFIEGLEKVANHIDNNRSYGTEFPDGVIVDGYGVIEDYDFHVPLENDQVYRSSDNYYANVGVDYSSIRLFDADGVEYVVTPEQ